MLAKSAAISLYTETTIHHLLHGMSGLPCSVGEIVSRGLTYLPCLLSQVLCFQFASLHVLFGKNVSVIKRVL